MSVQVEALWIQIQAFHQDKQIHTALAPNCCCFRKSLPSCSFGDKRFILLFSGSVLSAFGLQNVLNWKIKKIFLILIPAFKSTSRSRSITKNNAFWIVLLLWKRKMQINRFITQQKISLGKQTKDNWSFLLRPFEHNFLKFFSNFFLTIEYQILVRVPKDENSYFYNPVLFSKIWKTKKWKNRRKRCICIIN